MSIRDHIQKLVDDKELFCLESQMTGDETVRAIFVSKEVLTALTPPFEKEEAILLAEFRLTLDAFLEGSEISIAQDPFEKPAYALMARVDPIQDEFFDFRVTAPKPGIRALGGFSEKDTFVCLTWEFRDVIENFDAEVARCKSEWNRLFEQITPFKGNSLDEYLTNYLSV